MIIYKNMRLNRTGKSILNEVAYSRYEVEFVLNERVSLSAQVDAYSLWFGLYSGVLFRWML